MTLQEIKQRNEDKELLTVRELWDYVDSLDYMPELKLNIKELVLIAHRAGEIGMSNEYQKIFSKAFNELKQS